MFVFALLEAHENVVLEQNRVDKLVGGNKQGSLKRTHKKSVSLKSIIRRGEAIKYLL